MHALCVKQLSLTIGNKAILQDISFSLPQGQILAVLGPNGAGKTTLLKLLSGQIHSQGKILWKNKTLCSYSKQKLAQQIAVVNQLNETVFAVTLEQVVRMGLLPHKALLARDNKQDKQQITKAIQAVGLADKIKQQFSTLSGGEQQRALVARALVQRSSLLVLDEPVNHLDVFYQHQILQLLRDLTENLAMTAVISLHDLNLAANYCDQICLLDGGKLVAFGCPDSVLDAKQLTTIFNTPCEVRHNDDNLINVTFSAKRSPVLDLAGWR